MAKYGGKQTPAGGSGNSNECHGKPQVLPDNGPALPGPDPGVGIVTTTRQTGSNATR